MNVVISEITTPDFTVALNPDRGYALPFIQIPRCTFKSLADCLQTNTLLFLVSFNSSSVTTGGLVSTHTG